MVRWTSIAASLLTWSLVLSPAHAQQTKAALTAEINTNWPDNTSGAITPALLRNTVIDIVNSYQDLNGTSAFNCGVHNWVSAFVSLSIPSCTQPNFTDLAGGIATGQIGGGVNASTSTFLRGDLTWVAPSGSGTVTEQKNTAGTAMTTSGNCDNTSTNAGSPCQYNFAGSSVNLSDTVTTANWTPIDSSGATLSLTIHDAKYYKIGKLVTIIFNITYPSTVSAAAATIGGLPVLPLALNNADQGCLITYTGTPGNSAYALFSISTTNFALVRPEGRGAYPNSGFSTITIAGSCTYVAN